MGKMKISRTQNERLNILVGERRATKDVLKMSMENATNRIFETHRLEKAVWDEIIEQFNLDKSKVWTIGDDRIIEEKFSKGPTRGFDIDTMTGQEKDLGDTSS